MTSKSKLIIGSNLKNTRLKLGWTQKYVSEETGISIRTISRVETGVSMSAYTLNHLSLFYGISVVVNPKNENYMNIFSFLLNYSENTLNRNLFLDRQDILKFISDSLPKKTQYSLNDLINCCLQINRRTIQGIYS